MEPAFTKYCRESYVHCATQHLYLFFFFLDGEIRAEVEDTIFLGWENISRVLHNNSYLQSHTHKLRKELLRLVQKKRTFLYFSVSP